MKNYIVYKHTSPNNKVYIGITCKDPKRRWQNGNGYSTSVKFYRAIQKYGWENIKHEILFENLTKEQAEQKEIELIAFYNSTDERFGYNISSGGENHFAGYHHSEETKRKISNAQKGELNHMYGKRWKMSEEGKEKIRQSRLGMVFTEEHKKNISKGKSGKNHQNYGKHLSLETRIKISKSNGGKPICVYDKNTKEFIGEFNTRSEACSFLGLSENAHKQIGVVLKHKRKSLYGYIWRYKDEAIDKS